MSIGDEKGMVVNIELARLQERAENNKIELANIKTWVDSLSNDVSDVKDVQNQTLIVLQKMESSLEHLNEKMNNDHKDHGEIWMMTNKLQLSQVKTDTKFKLVLGILSVIGTTVIGVAIKILFFSPILSGG